MKKCKCKECKQNFNKNSNKIGGIYKENEQGVKINYFVCINCLDINKHYHQLNRRCGWSHLYGDISGKDLEWMGRVVAKTRDTICGEAGYNYLNT